MGKAKRAAAGRGGHDGAPDGAVYVGLLMIAAFGVWLWTILAGSERTEAWKEAVVAWAVILLALINVAALRTYFGRRLPTWQRSLARLVLRWGGYGTRDGRPLAAAHGARPARLMVMLGLAASVFVVAALAWLLYL